MKGISLAMLAQAVSKEWVSEVFCHALAGRKEERLQGLDSQSWTVHVTSINTHP